MAKALTAFPRQHVEIADLGGAMFALWKQIEESDDTPLCRALTLNLIAVTDADGAETTRRAVRRVLVRHACRAFVVVADAGGGDPRAELGAEVRGDGRSRQTCLEEIVLRMPAASLGKWPGLVRPLLVNDIPVSVWWPGPLPDRETLQVAARLADTLIVNSGCFADFDRDVALLAEVRDAAVIDVMSFRQRPWRRALAEAFESFAWQRAQPTRAVIRHGAAPPARAASAILAGWLRDRLGAAVQLIAVDRPGPAEAPESLELWHGAVHVEVRLAADEQRLRTTVTLDDVCLLPFDTIASRGEPGDLLAAAIDSA